MKKFIKANLLFTVLFSTPLISSCHKDVVTKAVTGIELNRKELDLTVNQKFQLEVTVSPADATYKLTWISTRAEVATVSETGLVEARSFGETTIKVTSDSGQIAECIIKVKEKDVASIEFEQATSVLFYGQKAETPRVKATYTDGSTGYIDDNLTLTSSDQNKVTLNVDEGTLTCVAELTDFASTTNDQGQEVLVPLETQITASVAGITTTHKINIYDGSKFFLGTSGAPRGLIGIHSSVDKLSIERMTLPEAFGSTYISAIGATATRTIAPTNKNVGLYGCKNLKYLCCNSKMVRVRALALNTLQSLETLVLPNSLEQFEYSNCGFANSLKEVRFLSGLNKIGTWDATNANPYFEIYDNKFFIQKYKHVDNNITTYHKALVFAYGDFNGEIPEEAGIEVLGNYAFFGLKRLNKTMVLPKTVRAVANNKSQLYTDSTVGVGAGLFTYSSVEHVVIPSEGNFLTRLNSSGNKINFGYATSYAIGANSLKSFGFDKHVNDWLPGTTTQSTYSYSNNSFHQHGVSKQEGASEFVKDGNGKVVQNYTSLYWGCEGTVIPEGVTLIDTNAFNGTNVSNIKLPSTLTTINGFSFVFCKSNKAIEIPASCKTLANTNLKKQDDAGSFQMFKDSYGDFFSVDEDTDYFVNGGVVSPFFNLPGKEVTIKVPFASGFNPCEGKNSSGYKWGSAWNVGVNVQYTNS